MRDVPRGGRLQRLPCLSAAMRRRSVHSHGVDAARCRTDVSLPRALVPPCSKVQETVEQIEFDLGMLDESIER
jgi:hypothetical protein